MLVPHGVVDLFIGNTVGNNFIDQGSADCRIDNLTLLIPLTVFILELLDDADLDAGLQANQPATVGSGHFLDVGEDHALALVINPLTSHPVDAQNDILGRYDDWLTVGRQQDVVGRHHQGTGFQLSFQRQRHVHSHLVAVEVSVIGRTDQRMQLDGLAFNQDGFESLDTETVKSRCPVEENGVFPDDLGQDIPDLGGFPLDHLLGCLDGRCQTTRFQLAEDKGFKQFQRHFLWQTALVQPEGRAYHDD